MRKIVDTSQGAQRKIVDTSPMPRKITPEEFAAALGAERTNVTVENAGPLDMLAVAEQLGKPRPEAEPEEQAETLPVALHKPAAKKIASLAAALATEESKPSPAQVAEALLELSLEALEGASADRGPLARRLAAIVARDAAKKAPGQGAA